MSASRLRLNPTKTEVVWLGASQHVSRINISDIPMLSTSIKVAEFARDLGVILDAELTMSAHVTALCLWQLVYFNLILQVDFSLELLLLEVVSMFFCAPCRSSRPTCFLHGPLTTV